MTRTSYVQIGKELYLKGTEPRSGGSPSTGPMIMGDEPDFVSPVDGKLYSGRAGMREHNARNDVINNRDLVGLPTLKTNSDFRTPAERRASAEHRKQVIINEVNRYYK